MMIPDRVSCHHTDSTHGRTQPCHHTNLIAGRTVNISICPTTTCTQTWGGRSTYHRMNSIIERSVCWEPHQSTTLQVERLQSASKISNHSNVTKPTSSPYCTMIAASSTKLRAKYIQWQNWSHFIDYHAQIITSNPVQMLTVDFFLLQLQILVQLHHSLTSVV